MYLFINWLFLKLDYILLNEYCCFELLGNMSFAYKHFES